MISDSPLIMIRNGVEKEPDGDSVKADVTHGQGRGHNLQVIYCFIHI